MMSVHSQEVSASENELILAKVELASISQSLGAGHPTVRSVAQRVKVLEGLVALDHQRGKVSNQATQLATAQLQLMELEKNLGKGHPQVQSARARVSELEKSSVEFDSKKSGPNAALQQELALEKAKLADLLRVVGIQHPKARSVSAHIRELESMLNTSGTESNVQSSIASQLATERKNLADLSRQLGAEHPRIKSKRASIAALEKGLVQTRSEVLPSPTGNLVDAELRFEKARQLQLKLTLGEEHPKVTQAANRVLLLEEAIQDSRWIDEELASLAASKPGESETMTRLRHTFEVDQILLRKVAKEFQVEKAKQPIDFDRFKEIEQKLNFVAKSALRSRQDWVRAEIEEVKQVVQKTEESMGNRQQELQMLEELIQNALNVDN